MPPTVLSPAEFTAALMRGVAAGAEEGAFETFSLNVIKGDDISEVGYRRG